MSILAALLAPLLAQAQSEIFHPARVVASSAALRVGLDSGLAYHAADGNLDTAWIARSPQGGVGEELRVELHGPTVVREVRIWGGDQRDGHLWRLGGRPRRVTVALEDWAQAFQLDLGPQGGTFDEQNHPPSAILRLPAGPAVTSLAFTIDDVVAGAGVEETFIAEIELWGERPPGGWGEAGSREGARMAFWQEEVAVARGVRDGEVAGQLAGSWLSGRYCLELDGAGGLAIQERRGQEWVRRGRGHYRVISAALHMMVPKLVHLALPLQLVGHNRVVVGWAPDGYSTQWTRGCGREPY